MNDFFGFQESVYTIQIPRTLDFTGAKAFAEALWAVPACDRLNIDFLNVSFYHPFGLLVVSTLIRNYLSFRPQTKVFGSNISRTSANSYAAHMGFFQRCGFDIGNLPGQASGSSTYLPINDLNCAEIKSEADGYFKQIGDVVETHAQRLASVLARSSAGDLYQVLEFSLREILRNAVEHSNSPVLSYCAQYWPKNHRVEIAILDAGIGVRSSLSQNQYLKIADDKDALKYAILPGVSGKVLSPAERALAGYWANSGYGLFMTSRLTQNGGSFLICSGAAALLLVNGDKYYHDAPFGGTAVGMQLDTSMLGSTKELLKQISKEGQEIARSIEGAIISSESASMMLSEYYKKKK